MKSYWILFNFIFKNNYYNYILKLLFKLRVNSILNIFQNLRQGTAKTAALQTKGLNKPAARLFPVLIMMLILPVILAPFFASAPVQAHELLIEGVSEGKVNAGFDDGTPAIQVDIKVYYEDELIHEGRTDRQGAMELPEGVEWDKIEARDNYGHRALYSRGEEEGFRLPRWAGALLGLSFLLLVAAFSGRRQK